jgi:toxin-antitoxin system PIN domain toxin
VIVPDANLLLYAYDSSSRFHEPAAAWWRECLSGSEPVGLCGAVLFAFVRIATSRRAFEDPMSIEEAAEHVRSWLGRPVSEFLIVEEADVVQALAWLEAAGSGGNLTTDAQIAAIAHRFGATVHTADTDFGRFADVRWVNPILQTGAPQGTI